LERKLLMKTLRGNNLKENYRARRFSSALSAAKLALAFILLVTAASTAKASGIYSGASVGSDGTVYGWGVTNVPGSPGYMYHYNYISGTLTSPNGRQASGNYNATDYARYDVSLPYDPGDGGTYMVQSLSSVYCTAAGAWIVWNAFTEAQADTVTVSIANQSNSNNFVFVGTMDDTVTKYNTQVAAGDPTGGSYDWTVSPESVTISPNNSLDGYLVKFTGSTASASAGGTTETVTYTLNSASATDRRAITLREFNGLTTPSTEGGCTDYSGVPPAGQGYLQELFYNILTSPGSQQVQTGFAQMGVAETSTVTYVNPSNYQFNPITGNGATTNESQVVDCLGIPSSSPLPSNLVVCARQTISVGGILVRTNTLKYTNTNVSIVSSCP
jgi:hypothetical protein